MTTPARPVSEYRVHPTSLLIDATCDRFEAGARAGLRPQIEEYLAVADVAWRRALLRELLLLEIELLRSAGSAPVPEVYRARFPGDIDLVDAAFAGSAWSPSGGVPRKIVPRPPSGQRRGPCCGSSDGSRVTASKTDRRALGSRLSTPAVGRYVVVEKLREGREAVVYLVVDPGLGKELVLEWARRPRPPAPQNRLAEEVRQLTGLAHPNLVRVVDVGDNDGRPYLVTEAVPGVSLEQYAARHRPTARRAAALLADLSGAVAYLNHQGFVGPGVKPENVLIDETGRPRLTGFGLARLQDDRPQAATGQADGPGLGVSPASDVFQLGALLHELLTGRPYLQGEDADEAVRQESSRERRAVSPRRVAPRVSKALERICLRALARDPRDRYPGAGGLERVLRRYLRRRAIVAAAFAVFVLVALAACAISFRPTPARSVSFPAHLG